MRRAVIGAFLISVSCVAGASPFVNVIAHPEIAALRPVTSLEQRAKSELPEQDSLPVVVLKFVPLEVDVWDRIRAGFQLPPLDIREVAESEAWYAARPELVTKILDRSRYYLFHIVDEIEKRGMPTELALLPFIESGYNPFALSRAQASGLWQFIPETANRYKLPQANGLDARRDVIASTAAALDHLQFLHSLFGDWHLALAAYNWGENQVARAIERNRARGLAIDFPSLVLPEETRRYVPKLLAVKRMLMDEAKFRISLPKVPNRPYFTAVPRPATVDVANAARLADMDVDEFRALNPAHGESIVNVSASMPFVVPVERAQTFIERLNEFLEKEEIRRKMSKPVKARPSRQM